MTASLQFFGGFGYWFISSQLEMFPIDKAEIILKKKLLFTFQIALALFTQTRMQSRIKFDNTSTEKPTKNNSKWLQHPGTRKNLHGSFKAHHLARWFKDGWCGKTYGFFDPRFCWCWHCDLVALAAWRQQAMIQRYVAGGSIYDKVFRLRFHSYCWWFRNPAQKWISPLFRGFYIYPRWLFGFLWVFSISFFGLCFQKKPGSRWFRKCIMISPHHIARNSVPEAHVSWWNTSCPGMKRVSLHLDRYRPLLEYRGQRLQRSCHLCCETICWKSGDAGLWACAMEKILSWLGGGGFNDFFIFTRSFWKVSSLNIWQLGGLLDFNVLSYLWIVLGVPPL